MSYSIQMHPSAGEELEESFNWYEQQQEGLGKRFLTCINKGIDRIVKDPERYAKKKGNYRELKVENFPFVIIYEVLTGDDIIFITYFFHTKRNPAFKYKR